MVFLQMEMNKKLINMSGLGLALEGTSRAGGHWKMLEKVSLEQISLKKKQIHHVQHAAEGSVWS